MDVLLLALERGWLLARGRREVGIVLIVPGVKQGACELRPTLLGVGWLERP